MSRIVSPKQFRVNDPYQQRILQFDTTDSRVYLSKVSNYLLRSIGDNAIIKGFDVENISVIDNIFYTTISSGLLIQDNTLIEVKESFELSLDISGFDSCSGYLVVYTNYQYLYSIEENQLRFKLSYITKDGLIMSPINDSWNNIKNKIFLNLYKFDNDNNITEILNPNYFYIGGKRYYKRGKLNFQVTDVEIINPFFFTLPHNQNSYKIFAQLYGNDYYQKSINTMSLENETLIRLSIDEYKEFNNYFELFIASADDCLKYEIEKTDNIYTLNHNLDQQYLMVQIYDEDYNLVNPRSIVLTSNNSLNIDFSNIAEDLAAKYYVLIIKDNIETYQILEENLNYENILIPHNLNKTVVCTQIISNTTNILFDKPNSVQLYDQNNILIDFSICDFPKDNYTVLIYNNVKTVFNLYSNNIYEIPYNYFVKQFTSSNLINNELLITHNLKQLYPIVQALDKDLKLVMLNNIQVIDQNTIKISFSDLSSLINTDLFSVIIYSYKQEILNIQNNTGDISIDLSSLETSIQNPIIQIYNEDKLQIVPNYINRIDEQNFILNLNDISFNNMYITATQGFNSYYEEFTTTNSAKVINHNLNTLYPIVQVYIDGSLYYPENITVQDTNNILVDLGDVSHTFFITIIAGLQKLPMIKKTDTYFIMEFKQTHLIDYQLIVDHNLNFEYPVTQVFDETNKVVQPDVIQITSMNQLIITFAPDSILESFYKIFVMRS